MNRRNTAHTDPWKRIALLTRRSWRGGRPALVNQCRRNRWASTTKIAQVITSSYCRCRLKSYEFATFLPVRWCRSAQIQIVASPDCSGNICLWSGRLGYLVLHEEPDKGCIVVPSLHRLRLIWLAAAGAPTLNAETGTVADACGVVCPATAGSVFWSWRQPAITVAHRRVR